MVAINFGVSKVEYNAPLAPSCSFSRVAVFCCGANTPTDKEVGYLMTPSSLREGRLCQSFFHLWRMPPIILLLSCYFHCPRITPHLAVLRPTSFPKRRGVRVMPLFVFDGAQRLHGCCLALALSAGHGLRKRACKPLGGFNYCSNAPTDGGGGYLMTPSWLAPVRSAPLSLARRMSAPLRLAPLKSAPLRLASRR